jgi:hypothetical protein
MWANAIAAAWKRLWQSGFPAYTQNLHPTSEAVCPIAVTMRRMQLRAETPQQAFQRLQSLQSQIVTMHKNNPARAMLESQARQAVKVIFSEGRK